MPQRNHQSPAELIKDTIAQLREKHERVAEELISVKSELKRFETALAALTGEPASVRAVTRAQVRDELVNLFQETPKGRAIPRVELIAALKERLKAKGMKLTNFTRRFDDVLGEEGLVDVSETGDVKLTDERNATM